MNNTGLRDTCCCFQCQGHAAVHESDSQQHTVAAHRLLTEIKVTMLATYNNAVHYMLLYLVFMVMHICRQQLEL